MIAQAFVFSVLVGLIRKGDIRNLARIPLRHVNLFIVAFAILAVVVVVALANAGSTLQPYLRVLNVIQYLVLLSAIAMNLHISMMWLAGLGTFLNFLAIAANKGMMPVCANAVELVGRTDLIQPERIENFVRHSMITPETRLKLITDIIPVPGYSFIAPGVASIGDLMIGVAMFMLVQHYMCSNRLTKNRVDTA